ncbi:MAG: hypothetical protein AVDCRST_MAG64-2696 [uncultured Phycisphaerae bacterium]|uniref:Uncharacterized protein n=1 Tax=uncultured Phycisphaerae bacterium TaxID=904963 RepID=A0A6J4PKL7_9BACT|nr:MAG: hypothetical protein AVDCRST_MAG64-2696 [uncultured Phycisphaerae bacterium]
MERVGPAHVDAAAAPLPVIAYGTPASGRAGFSVGRFLLWSVFVVGWAAAGTLGGAVGVGVLGESTFQGALGPIRDDDFWGLGAVLGFLAAITFCWLSRRQRWLHVLTAALATASLAWACVVLAGTLRKQPREWLWEVAVVAVAIWGSASIAVLVASVAGWLLSRRRRLA